MILGVRRLSRLVSVIALLGLLVIAAVAVQPVRAATTLLVNGASGTDSPTCGPVTACKTIGQAITNAAASGDTISVAAGTYAEHLVITKTVTIQGATTGATIIDGSDTGAVVTISSPGNVTLEWLTIQHGHGTVYGGGVLLSGGGTTTATIRHCLITANTGFYGGGIFSSGTLTVIDSTISTNTTTGNSGGGGILNANAASLTLINDTITKNSSSTDGGGLRNDSAVAPVIRNTIIADNTAATTGPDVSVNTGFGGVPIASSGNNLIGKSDGSSGWVASDKTGTIAAPLDAKLASLASNGGPTQTHALSLASPARDAIPTGTNGCGTTVIDDQRGFTRPQGSACDIGAFELRIALAVTSGGGQSTPVLHPFPQPLTVTATSPDLGNAFVPGLIITFTAPASGATATLSTPNPVTTAANGQASVNATANSVAGGPYTVTASTPGLPPLTFTLTNTAGLPASMTVNPNTTPQSTPVGASFSVPLAVTVKDSLGNLVPGAVVTFIAPVSGASGSFAGGVITATTNASGIATAPTFFANNTPGSYQVIAIVNGLTTTFALTNAGVLQPPSKPGAAPGGGVPTEESRAGSVPTGAVMPPPTGR